MRLPGRRLLLGDAVHAAAANRNVVDGYLDYFPERVEPPVGFHGGVIAVVSIAGHDHGAVGQIGVDVRAASPVPDAGVVDTFLDELELQSSSLCVCLVLERGQIPLTDLVVWIAPIRVHFDRPTDLDDLLAKPGKGSTYKNITDRVMSQVRALGAADREAFGTRTTI